MENEEKVVMDENVQNPENTGSNNDNEGSGKNPWGCGTIVLMFVVGLCVNMCSVINEM